MEVRDKKDNRQYFRDQLKLGDTSLIKVNGVEMRVCDYFAEAQKHNTREMSSDYIKQVEQEHEKALEDKKRLWVDPTSLKKLL